MEKQDVSSQEQEFDPTSFGQEDQEDEQFLFDALGLGDEPEEATSPAADAAESNDSVDSEEAAETEEATQEEDYTRDEDDVELDPARALPDRPQVASDKASDELDAAEARASNQSPEFRAMIEQQKQLRRLVAQQQEQLAEFQRQREEQELGDEEFLTDEDDLDQLFSSPKAFNSVLNRVYKKGLAKGKEQTLRTLDPLMDSKVRVHLDRRARAERFFSVNPELSSPKLKEFVLLVGQEIAEQNPDWDIETFYAHLGPEVKSRLGLAHAQQGGKGRPTSQAAVGGMNKAGGTRPPSKRKVGSMADEVAESLGL